MGETNDLDGGGRWGKILSMRCYCFRKLDVYFLITIVSEELGDKVVLYVYIIITNNQKGYYVKVNRLGNHCFPTHCFA